MQLVDQIIFPRWLIPVDSAQSVLQGHALAIRDDHIVAIDKKATIQNNYSAPIEIELDQHAVLPGFVNAHTHAAMTLLRGYADDFPLMKWLNEYIWRAEEKWVDAEFVEIGTDLALLEMLRSGTTCFNDMYFFPEVAAARATNAGMRACIGLIVMDFPTVWGKNADEYISKGLALKDSIRHSPLITAAFAPHAPYTVSDSPLEKIRTYASELGCRVHIHLHETHQEIEQSIAQYGERPLERLARLGLVDPSLIAVHMTHLLPGEIETIAEAGVKVVHCPQSNLKFGNGLCPVDKLIEKGISVAIGTDSAASNNDLDMLAETQTAALLAKGVAENPSALPAYKAIEAATLRGAEALGLDDKIGSLCVGKQADFIAIDLFDPATQPIYHPVSQIVYSATCRQVSDVWVRGKRILKNRQATTLDESEIIQKAIEFAQRIAI